MRLYLLIAGLLSFVFLTGCHRDVPDDTYEDVFGPVDASRKISFTKKVTRERDRAPLVPEPMAFKDASPKDEPLSHYGNPSAYQVNGQTYDVLTTSAGYHQRGTASWYGTKFHKKRTSSGDDYDMYALTAAHKTLPLPSYVRVKNLENGREVVLKVNDRGPFHGDRIIDLSYAAAVKLGLLPKGTASVEVEALTSHEVASSETAQYYLQAGAFQSHKKAKALCDKLYAHQMPTAHIAERDARYIVRLGPFASKEQSDTAETSLKAQGISDPFSFLH